MSEGKHLSRREFIRASALTVADAVLAACGAEPSPTPAKAATKPAASGPKPQAAPEGQKAPVSPDKKTFSPPTPERQKELIALMNEVLSARFEGQQDWDYLYKNNGRDRNKVEMYRKANKLYESVKGNPEEVRFILPAIFFEDLREQMILQIFDARQKGLTPNHKPLNKTQIDFCKKHDIGYELFACVLEIHPLLIKLFGENKVISAPTLTKLLSEETKKGMRLGQEYALVALTGQFKTEGEPELKRNISLIAQYTGLRYNPSSVVGSLKPDKEAVSGGAVGVQIMPTDLKHAVVIISSNEAYVNPWDIFNQGIVMAVKFLNTQRWPNDPFWENSDPEKIKKQTLMKWNPWEPEVNAVLEVLKAYEDFKVMEKQGKTKEPLDRFNP